MTVKTYYDLLSYTDRNECGCWIWRRAKSDFGYGIVYRPGVGLVRAHRMAWEMTQGPIPSGLVVLHKCDTPACINPDHLRIGTKKQNSEDMVLKGRTNGPKGERCARAKLTQEQVLAIRLDGRTTVEIAAEYGVHHSNISRIKRGLRWSHI
jgi:hypothetical protein